MNRREYISGIGILGVAFAGCSRGSSDNEFRTEEIVFTTSRATEYGEYEREEGATYKRGDFVWFYIGVKNATPENGLVRFHAEFEVTTPEDNSISSQQELEIDVSDQDPENTFITNGVETTDSWPLGEYEVEVTVTDKVAEKTDSIVGNFTLE